MIASFLRTVLVSALAAAFLSIVAAPACADYSVNGLGFGTARGQVWCYPNKPPAAPDYSSTVTGFVPTVHLGPGLPGCDPNTQVFVSAGSLWRANTLAVARNGDTVAWGHDLWPLITPVSLVASTSLTVDTTVVGSSVDFLISWSGTDSGTAQRLDWYDVSIPTAPVLLGSETRVGAWSEAIVRTFTMPGGSSSNLEMRSEGIASTVPEPGSLMLLGLAAMGLVVRRRR